ncbi:MAG TPA: hypothetical protein PKE27_18455 [Povalibacter sp.]|uniref:hypothetical protein n=1 Tax=Povalibacter sp. TaxID=1962978 RepID=UPI002C0E80EF|nr:hypothetical protein [Povalibacter sp.]HMN46565.1 hypothetical protein [Povalibacter sp.]
MSTEKQQKIQETAERIIELGNELEAPGHAAVDEASLLRAREVLHRWVDDLKGVVVNAALGRVTVIQEDGYASSIASAELAFRLSAAGITQSGGR